MGDTPFNTQFQTDDAWYILYDDGHHGPFSLNDMKALARLGEIGQENLVWHASFTHWQKPTQVLSLKDLINTQISYKANLSPEMTWIEKSPTPWLEPLIDDPLLEDPPGNQGMTEAIIADEERFKPRKLRRQVTFALGILTLVAAGILGGNSIFNYYRFSDLDISPEDRESMTSAYMSPAKNGWTASLVTASGNLYVASNLSDGTEIKIQIFGQRETLLNSLYSETNLSLTTRHGLAQWVIDTTLPQGSYEVLVRVGETILARKTVFLGTKDEKYQEQLKAYHQGLQTQASTERIEIVQLTETLEMQLSDTQTQYALLKKKQNQSDWHNFHTQWTSLQEQLRSMFLIWSPQYIISNFYYHGLYSEILNLSKAVEELHSLQTSGADDTAIADKSAIAHGLLNNLKNHISHLK